MKFISIGGFFHDLNYTFYDSDNLQSLISVEEERFSRIKGHSLLDDNISTDFLGLDYILSHTHTKPEDIDYCVLSDKIDSPFAHQILGFFPSAKVVRIGHHKSHIFNVRALNTLPDTEQADCIILDGYGDNLSGQFGNMMCFSFECHGSFDQSASLGLLYTSATQHLGLGSFGNEGKLQGLAPYGEYKPEYSIHNLMSIDNKKIIFDQKLNSHTGFQDQELYAVAALATNEYYSEVIPKRFPDEPLERQHMDFAFTVQEDIFSFIIKLINQCFPEPSKNLLFSGGMAQNSTLINRMKILTGYQRVITSTSCSDRGNSLGALFAFLSTFSIELPTPNNFLGIEINPLSQEKEIDLLPHIAHAAELINSGKVLAIVDGRAELGARALGNRSIIANPNSTAIRDHINSTIKKRELFRPFAPICIDSYAKQYFDFSLDDFNMTRCVKATPLAGEKYPGIVHVDGTSRLQILSNSDSHRLIYKLMIECLKSHGIEVLLNTSLNQAGQAIVNTYNEAYDTSKAMGIDALLSKKGLEVLS